MFGSAARKSVAVDPARALYDTIGALLVDHRLAFSPANYAFAHRLLSDPDGPLARTVARLTDGGVRLSERDVATLTGNEPAAVAPAAAGASDSMQRVTALVAQTRSQMNDFAGLMDRMRAETNGFGRDLAASVDAIDPAEAPALIELTAAMLARVQSAEARLETATDETATLRAALEEARVDAREDALTGLPNRRALAEAFDACAAQGEAMCLAICDVDHFKQINDRFGHGVGDRVLTALSGTLTQCCPDAMVARYGGEEFALLFSGETLAGAQETLELARATVAAKRYRLRDMDTLLGTVTFSGGIVAVRPGEPLDDAFARADALLYSAKNEGRNRIAG